MTKLIALVILSIVLLQPVLALPGRIQILDLEYKENKLLLVDKFTKLGYYPDRKIQPDEGFTCKIVTESDQVLYTFRFEVPTKIFVDVTDPVKDELSGGIVELNQTRFALVIPYFKEAKEIQFYDKKDYEVLSVAVSEEKLASKKGIVWLLAGGILLLISLISLLTTRKKQKS